jgi:DNA end-binding protein Ku
MLDDRNGSPVHNKRVNEQGEEVPWEHVIKGYLLDDGRWVRLTEEDLKAANVETTQTIDVIGAVCVDEVPLSLHDSPYYLAPDKPGIKAYALLREALSRAGRVAIGRVVIRSRQRLCVLVPQDTMLALEVLRWPYEIRDATDVEVPGSDLDSLGITSAEMDLAMQLVHTIESSWQPETYRDSYHDDLLALIDRKAAGMPIEQPPEPPPVAPVVDIAEMLKRSVEEARRARSETA